ncbi:ferroxidase fet3 [Coemansia sp. RSA 552]|nr:ferroxidase fet3 [Coemansia sp. RSA 552]
MATFHLPLVWLAFAVALMAAAKRVELDWDITYVHVNRDGYNQRRAIGVNGQLPIPPVYVDHGDTLLIHVHNSLDNATTLHAHGMFHNGTTYEDGAGGVTECGIPPGGRHTYTIRTNQVGTFWIHGHNLHQNMDGLCTPFIIREPESYKRDYDEELLISLEDWHPTESIQRLEELSQFRSQGLSDVIYPYGLINGYNGNDTEPIKFASGKRYRFRLVSMSTIEWWKFSIPGHKLEVIEIEGEYTKPCKVDGLDMGPGQRISVIVTAQDTDAYNFYYNATMYNSILPTTPGENPRYYKGLIEYRKDAPVWKEASRPGDRDLVWADDIDTQNLDGEPALLVDRQMEFTVQELVTTEGANLRALNEYAYDTPLVPSLFTAMSEGELAGNRAIYGPQAEAHILKHMEVVEVRINNPMDPVHVFHLHGHNFQIIEHGPVDPATVLLAPDSKFLNSSLPPVLVRRNLDAPIRRDTMIVPGFTYFIIRFRADNPGVWLFHCHMDIHFGNGLAVTFIEAPDVLQRQQQIPKKMQEMCLAQGRKSSGNAAGNPGFDFTGLPPVPEIGENQYLVKFPVNN